MKTIFQKWVIIPFLCWANYAYTQTTSDTLVANISDRARIYFIGQSKEDFKEIEKYDLNVVFKTLQQQAQNKKVKLSATQAEELRNDAFLTKKPKTSFWKKTHFNFYVGAVGGFSSEYLVYNKDFSINSATGSKIDIEGLGYATFHFLPQLNLGLRIFREKKIIQTLEKEFVFRYGLGYQRLKIKPSYSSSPHFRSKEALPITEIKALLDTIERNYKGPWDFTTFNSMHYANLEFIPTFRKLTSEGKTKWELGVGFRGGIGGQRGLLRRTIFSKLQTASSININLLTTPKSDFWVSVIPLDYALVANFGYKYLKFFAEYHPYVFRINHAILDTKGQRSYDYERNGLWSVGLRFGK
jgi:hypothetical protein